MGNRVYDVFWGTMLRSTTVLHRVVHKATGGRVWRRFPGGGVIVWITSLGRKSGHASVSLHDDSIQIGPMALTRKMCPDLAMKVEAAVTSVLQGNVPYLLSADVLAVGTAARLLVYRSDLPPAA